MEIKFNFESLAPELLLPIMVGLSDLESLGNLLQASPAASHLFNSYSAEIFEAVLSSGDIHEYTCALIRIVVLIRSSRLPRQVYDLKSFQNMVRHESTSHRYYKPKRRRRGLKPKWLCPPTRLPLDIPASVLRGVLATHRRISCLMIGCLKFYLFRFKALRPSHLADEDFRFETKYGRGGQYIPSRQLKPEEKPFPVEDIGSVTWVEEQRVIRAFWRVQLLRSLKAACNAGSLRWATKDLDLLNSMRVAEFHNVPLVGLVGNNRWQHPDPGEPCVCHQDALLEHELIYSVIKYIKEERQSILQSDIRQIRRDWPTPTTRVHHDLQTLSSHTSWTYKLFYELGGRKGLHYANGPCSPLQHASFKPFRSLGFAIWSEERMVAYGLLEPDRKPLRHSYWQAWRSILGKDDLLNVERSQQRYESSYDSTLDSSASRWVPPDDSDQSDADLHN